MPKDTKIDKDKIGSRKNAKQEISKLEDNLRNAKDKIKGNPNVVAYLEKLEERVQLIEETIGLKD